MKRRCPAARSERGGAIVAVLVIVVVCVAIAGSAILTNVARRNEAAADLHRERAFSLAEAGLDWGISKVRAGGSTLPSTPSTGSVANVGSWRVTYTSGAANGRDDDGDGTVDESGESTYTTLTATGRSGPYQRSLEVLLFRPLAAMSFDAATQFNVDAPILSVSGNAFRINGYEHLIDGTQDNTRSARYGVASPALASVIINQIPSNRRNNVTGLGSNPSVGQISAIDLDAIADQAARAAGVVLTPGTHTNGNWGTPTVGGTAIVYCDGDLHMSGGSGGAGILVVDGDLRISGGLEWVGVIIVRGRATMVGGGGGKRVIGALIVGEEVETDTSGTTTEDSTQTVSITGTVDLFYSSDAIGLAANALSVPLVAAWREVGTP